MKQYVEDYDMLNKKDKDFVRNYLANGIFKKETENLTQSTIPYFLEYAKELFVNGYIGYKNLEIDKLVKEVERAYNIKIKNTETLDSVIAMI